MATPASSPTTVPRQRVAQRPAEPAAYFDPAFGAQALKVLPGEYIVTDRDVMLVTVLGSCVSACIRDPIAQVGGMNHFMLPDTSNQGTASESARYGGYAMETMINELLKRGARRQNLEAKVFGGGAVLAGFSVNKIGERNGQFVLEYLAAEHIAVAAQDLFDIYPRRVHYFPKSGKVMVRRLPSTNEPEVLASEGLYRSRLRQAPIGGTVELFE